MVGRKERNNEKRMVMAKSKKRKHSSSIPLCHSAVIGKALKYLYVFVSIVAVVLIIAILFLRLWLAFGARASREKMEG